MLLIDMGAKTLHRIYPNQPSYVEEELYSRPSEINPGRKA